MTAPELYSALVKAGVDPYAFPSTWWERLLAIYKHNRWGMPACLRLLKSKPRSSFKQSLREQLIDWLEGTVDKDEPFSLRQWACVMRKG